MPSFCTVQASGVAVHDDCQLVFNELKLKHDKKYIIFKMNDKMTEIQVFLLQSPAAVSIVLIIFVRLTQSDLRMQRTMNSNSSSQPAHADMEFLMSSTLTLKLGGSGTRSCSSAGNIPRLDSESLK